MKRVLLKPHRSYLVNMQYVDTIEKQITLQTSITIPITQGRHGDQAAVSRYQMEAE